MATDSPRPASAAQRGATRSAAYARTGGMSDASPRLHDLMVTFATAADGRGGGVDWTASSFRESRATAAINSPLFTAALLKALTMPGLSMSLLQLNPLLTSLKWARSGRNSGYISAALTEWTPVVVVVVVVASSDSRCRLYRK